MTRRRTIRSISEYRADDRMMKKASLLTVIAGVVTALGGSACKSDSTGNGLRTRAASRPPATITVLTSEKALGGGSFIIGPPPEGAQPTVDGNQAVDLAWQELDPSVRPSGVIAALGIHSDQLDWLVSFQGLCIHPHEGNQGTCAADELNILIDGTSGSSLGSYADSD